MRRIELEGLPNTRDLGGIINKDGRKIKKHCLLRSGQLFNSTLKDRDVLLNEYKLKQVFDFRSFAEVEEKPDPKLPGVNYFHIPTMKEITKGITREKNTDKDTVKMIILDMANDLPRAEKYMEDIYTNLVNDDYALSQYAKFIDHLLNNDGGSSLWHCTAGKDRAGFATFLVLECLNVDKEIIIQDYLLTNEYVKNDINLMVASIKKDYNFPLIDQVVGALFGIKREYLEKVYETIDTKYGGIKKFLLDKIKVDEIKMKKLQNLYLE